MTNTPECMCVCECVCVGARTHLVAARLVALAARVDFSTLASSAKISPWHATSAAPGPDPAHFHKATNIYNYIHMYVCIYMYYISVWEVGGGQWQVVYTHHKPRLWPTLRFIPMLNTILPVVASGRCGAKLSALFAIYACSYAAFFSFSSCSSSICCCSYSLQAHNWTRLPPGFAAFHLLFYCARVHLFLLLLLDLLASWASSATDLQVVINVIRVNACSKPDSAYLPSIIKASGPGPSDNCKQSARIWSNLCPELVEVRKQSHAHASWGPFHCESGCSLIFEFENIKCGFLNWRTNYSNGYGYDSKARIYGKTSFKTLG